MLKKVLNCNELWVGEKKGIVAEGVPILLVHTETGFYAFHDRCPHAGARLSCEGMLNNDVLTCGRHLWQFDACTGQGINPANSQLQRYYLHIDEAEDIWIDIDCRSGT